jgi:hypothetical protein
MSFMFQGIRFGDRASPAPRHRTALGRMGGSQCITDIRPPIDSDWAGHGQRPAGTSLNLNRAAARLPLAGLTDSDSDSDGGLNRDPAGLGGPGSQSPVPCPPGDGPAAPPAPADGPAAPPAMPQVHTMRYIHIRMHTYSVHTDTYRYRHIYSKACCFLPA